MTTSTPSVSRPSPFHCQIDHERIPGVLHLGYHSSGSFGATPYLFESPDGNVMVDVPRFNKKLANTIEAEGGIKFMILTHKDDVADNEK